MWPFAKHKSFLGIDIGSGGIKLVELRLEKKRPVLFTYGFTTESRNVHKLMDLKTANSGADVELDYNDEEVKETVAGDHLDEYAGAISQICKQAKTVSKTAVVSLPVSLVFHALVTVPKMKKEDFNATLRGEIKKLLPRPVEEMALDYQIINTDPKDGAQRVLVNAVPGELVEFYSKVFQKAGLQLDAIEPESAALSRSLVGKDDAVVMLIDIGAERTNFFIVDGGVPLTHHSIELGGDRLNKILVSALGVKEIDAEQIKIDLSDKNEMDLGEVAGKLSDILFPVFDPIEKEVQYNFDLYTRQSGNGEKRPEKIILTGGASLVPGLPEYLSAKFQIKCYIGDPWARVVYQDGIRPLLRAIGPRMSVAIGLALRNMV